MKQTLKLSKIKDFYEWNGDQAHAGNFCPELNNKLEEYLDLYKTLKDEEEIEIYPGNIKLLRNRGTQQQKEYAESLGLSLIDWSIIDKADKNDWFEIELGGDVIFYSNVKMYKQELHRQYFFSYTNNRGNQNNLKTNPEFGVPIKIIKSIKNIGKTPPQKVQDAFPELFKKKIDVDKIVAANYILTHMGNNFIATENFTTLSKAKHLSFNTKEEAELHAKKLNLYSRMLEYTKQTEGAEGRIYDVLKQPRDRNLIDLYQFFKKDLEEINSL